MMNNFQKTAKRKVFIQLFKLNDPRLHYPNRIMCSKLFNNTLFYFDPKIIQLCDMNLLTDSCKQTHELNLIIFTSK